MSLGAFLPQALAPHRTACSSALKARLESLRGMDAPAAAATLARSDYRPFRGLQRGCPGERMIAQAGLYPSNCRLLDAAAAMLNAGVLTGASVLVLAFQSADHPVTAWLDRGLEIIKVHGGTLPSPAIESDTAERY